MDNLESSGSLKFQKRPSVSLCNLPAICVFVSDTLVAMWKAAKQQNSSLLTEKRNCSHVILIYFACHGGVTILTKETSGGTVYSIYIVKQSLIFTMVHYFLEECVC